MFWLIFLLFWMYQLLGWRIDSSSPSFLGLCLMLGDGWFVYRGVCIYFVFFCENLMSK